MAAQDEIERPRALHIVLNGVLEDSRVLKCAWSLGNEGWDVLVCGATPFTHEDQFRIGYARIWRLPVKVVVQTAGLAKFLRRARSLKRRIEAKVLPRQKPMVPNLRKGISEILPVAKDFSPDVIHAHDYTALPIAGAIVEELRRAGKPVALVYDAHEYVPGVAHLTKPLADLYSENERKYSAISEVVLSVSEGMSDLLVPHLQITRRPEIVANDPLVEGQQESTRNLRDDCGIGPEVPLMVYSGAVAPQRGVSTAVEALRKLPEVHLAVIVNPNNATIKELRAGAMDLADRFHVLPYVPNSELVSYLSSADIGLIPLHHRLNHEISLITKFGEYMQARLPIVVSDVKTMAEEVRRLGNGEVFVAERISGFVEAVSKVLADPAKYRAAYTEEHLRERSWERQGKELVAIYNRIAKKTSSARAHLPFAPTQPEPLNSRTW